MNILITAIGSMSTEATIAGIRKFNKANIIGCDIHPENWLHSAKLVDSFVQIPKATSADYITTLENLVRNHQIDYIIPLTDPEVDVLSQYDEVFSRLGAVVCISENSAIKLSRDKYELYKKFKGGSSFQVIPTYLRDDIELDSITTPVIAKPINGRSSEGLYNISNMDVIQTPLENWSNYIFQPYIEGDIYTVDYIRDRFGNHEAICRKELIRTSNGAGLTVETMGNEILEGFVNEIGCELGILGCINLEFIFDGHEYYLMDINPRFSAGVKFSNLSGYDMIENHLRCFMDLEIYKFDSSKNYGIYVKTYSEVKL